MKLRVLFFAGLREQLEVSSLEAELPGERATVSDLRAALASRSERWASALGAAKLRIAVNQDLCDASAAIRDGDEVAFFPPVTGG